MRIDQTMSSIDINELSTSLKEKLRAVTNHSDISKIRGEVIKSYNIHPNSKRVELKAKTAMKLYTKGEYSASVLKMSEYIEDYITLHIIDTIPLKYYNQDNPSLMLGVDSYEKALDIDIDCLSEALDNLLTFYRHSDNKFNVIQFLEKIESIIDSDIWNEKILLSIIFVKAFIHDDYESAKKEIHNLNDIFKINDLDLLTVCLDLFQDELSHSENIAIIDKIIKKSDSPTIKLEYQHLLGIKYVSIGVQSKAIEQINEAIDDFYINEKEKDDSYTYFVLGKAYYSLGILKEDSSLFSSARKKFEKVLSFNDLNDKGKAMLFKLIADCYKYEGNHETSDKYYIDSLKLEHLYITIIDLLGNLTYMDDSDEKINYWIKKIDFKILNENEKYDYLVLRAKLAIKDDDYKFANKTLEYLKKLDVENIYFNEFKGKVVKQLQDYCDNRTADSKSKFTKLLLDFKSRIMFQPNINGIGYKIKKD